jgi:hypothetical protein
MDHEMYLLSCAAQELQPSNLFRCPGLTLRHLIVDSMHAADLGTFCDALGSLFYLEVRNKDWYPNQLRGLQALNHTLTMYFGANKELCKTGPLVLTQIIAPVPGYPYLKAKAAQVRHLAEFGLILANMHAHGNDQHARYRFRPSHILAGREDEHLRELVATFQGMTRYVRSLSAVPFDPDACLQAMMLYLTSMSRLHDLWRIGFGPNERSKQPFQLRQKCHMLQHMVQDQIQDYGSPSHFWCYRDEDYVGNVKRICAKTKDPRTLESRVMQKLKILEGLGHKV